MNCCNANGECEHGPGCPAGAATVAPLPVRSCEALGVCQHPVSECSGACAMAPRLMALAGAPHEGSAGANAGHWQPLALWLVVTALAGLLAGLGIGALSLLGPLWPRGLL